MTKSGLLDRAGALPLREAGPASLLLHTLRGLGWHRSVRERASVDADGESTPWWTYSATRWLDLALRPEHAVFEFGSGASTLWLAPRVARVDSVEHNREWEARVRPGLPDNSTLTLVEAHGTDADAEPDDPYLEPLRASGRQYDLIIVDGMGRNACVREAQHHLTDGGIILLDDGDRVAYRAAHDAMREAGFGRLDFFGPKPGAGHMSTTVLFSRDFDRWAAGLDYPTVSGY